MAKANYEIRGARPDRRVIERIADLFQPFTLHLPAYFHQLVFAQGRIGVENTFVLLEEGVTEFTNIAGLAQVRFNTGEAHMTEDHVLAVLANKARARGSSAEGAA